MQKEDPMELQFEGLEMQKCNIQTERTRRAGEKNEVICIVTIFTPKVMVIKMSKMVHFCIFC